METTVPKRPHSRDPEILAAAAARMVDGVREKFEGISDDEIAKCLTQATLWAKSLDGYDIARQLEKDHLCEPDAEMVEMLDSAYGYVSQAHLEAVKLWVAQHKVTLKRRVGDHRDDAIIKIEFLQQIRDDGYEPIMAFEDRARVVAAWRVAGVPCAQVAEGQF